VRSLCHDQRDTPEHYPREEPLVSVRRWIGKGLEATLGDERTAQVRRLERRARRQLASRIDRRRVGDWLPSDPFVPHPTATVTRHDLLRGLHDVLAPRTYLEIGVNEGSSLTLSRARTIAVDPDFRVRRPLHCDLSSAISRRPG
jgi:hypothetical protein